MRIRVFVIILKLLLIVFSFGCTPRLVRQMISPSESGSVQNLPADVKVHMKDGSLYVLDSLITYKYKDTIEAYGTYYNAYRDILSKKTVLSKDDSSPAYLIALSDVALMEVNNMTGLKGRSRALALVAVPTVLLTGYCLANPKACFGSCPTFYAWDGQDTTLMAEGFSSSILKIYEKEDIDMLYRAESTQETFNITVKNEALETHIIREADLLIIERDSNERVFATDDGEFYKITGIHSPYLCNSNEGDCLDAILEMDEKERYCGSDPRNLSQREFLEISFSDVPATDQGLIISCRQTLMTTYLFYQALAYLGNTAGYFAAKLESGNSYLRKKTDRVWDLLGGIEVFIKNSDQKWEKVHEIREMGPIASDIHLIKLPGQIKGNVDIRLRLTKGLWRIDYIALGSIDQEAQAHLVRPKLVKCISDSHSDMISVPQLNDPEDPLITLPGDIYEISYDMPSSSGPYEIFLKSRGYYIEWMRETWIMEENLKKAALLFAYPKLFMKKAADDFKIIEPSMEVSFWNSKYVRH